MHTSVMRRLAGVSTAFALVSIVVPAFAAEAPSPSPPGAQIYSQACAACHDHPKDRIPPRDQIATSPLAAKASSRIS